jgi:hypothetical protein
MRRADQRQRLRPVIGNLDETAEERRIHQVGDRWPRYDEGERPLDAGHAAAHA